MIFGAFPLDQAAGAVLAHSHRLGERVLKKGSVLDEAAIAALRGAGRSEVIAARLEPGDVAENESAERLARAFDGPGLSRRRAVTGRVNVHADAAGVLRVDAALLDRVNLVDEALTVATLADFSAVAAGAMLATIKVIPFAVPGAVLAAAEAAARSGPALRLHPFRRLRAGLVLSELPGMKESVIEGTIAATAARIAGLGGTLLAPLRCAHTPQAIGAALARLAGYGAQILLVAGASATIDRRDVGPEGVVRAGGEIVHFGMPVDPGNLICIGRIGDAPALVLPGCARSPRPNGIDMVLQRLFAGLEVGAAEVMRMGVGGLLKDTEARPLPRAKAVGKVTAPPPRVAAIVLAAGQSSRMAPHHKLLVEDRGGKKMIARVVDNILSSGARPVLVVIGHRGAELRAALAGRPVQFVEAAEYALGLSASLKAGLAALPEGSAAALICLGDMPLVTGRMLDRIIASYDPDEGRSIVTPVHWAQPGNPMLWDRRYFSEMATLTGDGGARGLLARHAEQVAEVEIGDEAVLRDFDDVESLAGLPERMRPVLS